MHNAKAFAVMLLPLNFFTNTIIICKKFSS